MENICLECSNLFISKENDRKFCGLSCSAKYNNRSRRKHPDKNCKNCGKVLSDRKNEHCSFDCSWEFRRTNEINSWLNGEIDGSGKNGELRTRFRDYLIDEAENKCSCGWGIPNPVTGKPILTIDHIDGNWMNNSRENLRVLCYNCHTLTPTFGRLNRNSPGNRALRAKRAGM